MGSWGACSDDYTCEQTYSISTLAANGGTSCPVDDGDTQYCSNDSGCSNDSPICGLFYFSNLSLELIISNLNINYTRIQCNF